MDDFSIHPAKLITRWIKMPLTVQNETTAEEIKTQYSATIRMMSPMIVDNHKDTMPTFRIFKENQQEYDFPPDEKFNVNMVVDMQDSYGMSENAVFVYKTLDPITQQMWGLHKFNTSASINRFQQEHYKHGPRSLIDLSEENLISMRKTLTWRRQWDVWSKWNDLNTSLDLDLYTTLGALGHRNPPHTKLHYLSNTDRPYSIPMLIRKHVTGHTIGNISSSNTEWRSMVEDAPSYTPTRATTGINVDVVTNDAAATGALGEFSVDVVADYLMRFQTGGGYSLLCCLPFAHYNLLASFLVSQKQQTDEALRMRADLGIDSAITYAEFDCVFYTDPLANLQYPYSLWFYDPQVIFPIMDAPFAPEVVPYEKISGTNQYGTTAVYNTNNICIDPIGTGAMHGWEVK